MDKNVNKKKPYIWRVIYNDKPLKDFEDFVTMHKFYCGYRKVLQSREDDGLLTFSLVWKTED